MSIVRLMAHRILCKPMLGTPNLLECALATGAPALDRQMRSASCSATRGVRLARTGRQVHRGIILPTEFAVLGIESGSDHLVRAFTHTYGCRS